MTATGPRRRWRKNTGTRNHKWQRLTPSVSRSCAVFPDGEHQAAENGNAAFSLWQPYSCCKKSAGSDFLAVRIFLRNHDDEDEKQVWWH
ncbi:TraU family protein [Escherichia coli]